MPEMLFSKSPRLGRASPGGELREMDPSTPKRGNAARAFRSRPGSAPGGDNFMQSNQAGEDKASGMTADDYFRVAMTVSKDRVEVRTLHFYFKQI